MAYSTISQAIELVNAANISELKVMLGISINSSNKIKRKMKTNTHPGLIMMENAFKDNAIPHTVIETIMEMNSPKGVKRAAKVTKTVEVKRVNLNDYMGAPAIDSYGRDYEYNRTIVAAEDFIDLAMCQPEAAELLATSVFKADRNDDEWLTMTEILASLDNGAFLSDKAFGRLKGALSKRMNNIFTDLGKCGFVPDVWNRYGIEFKESMIDRTGHVLRFNVAVLPEILRTIGIVAKKIYDANPCHPCFEGKIWVSFDELLTSYKMYPTYLEQFMNSKGEKLPEFNGYYIPQIGLITDKAAVQAIIGRRLGGR